MSITADEIRGAAFRRLLRTSAPLTVADITGDLGRPAEDLESAVEELARQGRVRLDGEGRVVGSAGLSIEPDRHQIDLDGRRFWTWCAYDILGIFGALGATGQARSSTLDGNTPVEVRFRGGRPEPAPVVLFLPDEDFESCCESMYDQWCPNSNFFESAEAASAWAKAQGVTGRPLTLEEATDLGTARWKPLAEGLPAGGMTPP